LVAYHIFDAQHRGRGVGTKALSLLQQYTASCTDLSRLYIITSQDNPASQRIAQKYGFSLTAEGNAKYGPNPAYLLEFVWDVPARTA